jgi:hypothetical protein
VGVSDDGYAEYCLRCGHWWPLVEDYDMDPAWEKCAAGDSPKFAEGDQVRDFRDGWVGTVNWFRPGYKIMVTWRNGARSVWWTHGWNARALMKVTTLEDRVKTAYQLLPPVKIAQGGKPPGAVKMHPWDLP